MSSAQPPKKAASKKQAPPATEDPKSDIPDESGSAEATDPIEAVRGKSAKLRSVFAARWPGGRRYVSENVAKALVVAQSAARRRDRSDGDGSILVTAADFLAGMVTAPEHYSSMW